MEHVNKVNGATAIEKSGLKKLENFKRVDDRRLMQGILVALVLQC